MARADDPWFARRLEREFRRRTRSMMQRAATEYNVNVLAKTFITASAIVLCAHLAFASDKQVAAEATPTPSPPAPLMYLLDQAGLAQRLHEGVVNDQPTAGIQVRRSIKRPCDQ